MQTNRGHVRGSRLRRQQQRNATHDSNGNNAYNPVSASARERGNKEIQKHEQRRRLENRLLEFQEELESSGRYDDDPKEIDRLVQQARERELKFIQEKEDAAEERKRAVVFCHLLCRHTQHNTTETKEPFFVVSTPYLKVAFPDFCYPIPGLRKSSCLD